MGRSAQGGALLRYHAGQWALVPGPTPDALFGVWMFSADAGWAVGAHGAILRYADGRWRAEAAAPEQGAAP